MSDLETRLDAALREGDRLGAIRLIPGDCLQEMSKLGRDTIDMILCDLPYGTTACKWDTPIDLGRMWEQFYSCLRPDGAIVLTASQPFTSVLVCSNLSCFKYEWIWEKDGGSNFATTKFQPMKEHESVLVFGNVGRTNYFPIPQERIGSRKGRPTTTVHVPRNLQDNVYGETMTGAALLHVPELRCPRSIQRFTRERGLHPTQKPVALFEYLIKTYTKENAVVLDACAGSGTTGLAARNTGRRAILIENDPVYIAVIRERLSL